MSNFAGHRGLWTALAVAIGFASQATFSAAQEPRNKCELRLELRGPDVPLLTEIPFIGRFFQAQAAQHCEGEACQVERIGVDFNTGEGFAQPVDAARLWRGDCQVCPLPGKHAVFEWLPAQQCQAGACASGQCAASCAEGKCSAGKCCPAAEIHVVSAAACCGGKCATGDCASKCCAAGGCADCPCKSEKTAHNHADVNAENAALKATIAGQDALLAAKSEMFESLARLMVENAKLEAKLEMVEHRDEMLKEMVELQAQNTELKLTAELAEEQQGQLEEQLEMVLENERLKLRIADLERSKETSIRYPATAPTDASIYEVTSPHPQLLKPALPDLEPVQSSADRFWSDLGLKLSPVEGEVAISSGRTYRGGLKVTDVRKDGLAYRAGMRPGDVLVGIHVWETVTLENLIYILNRKDIMEIGKVIYYVVRDNKTLFGDISLAGPQVATGRGHERK